jgi:ABC-type branched-subunit amino acid transport system permease subunit
VFGFSFDPFTHPVRFGLFSAAVLILMALVTSNVRRSSTGRKMLAVRSNERAASAAGISVSRMKLQAFALSSFIAGIGGALLAQSSDQATYSVFASGQSIALFTVCIIGGIASIQGAAIAGLAAVGGVLALIFSNIPNYEYYYLAIAGVLLIVTVLAQPDGVAPKMQEDTRRLYGAVRRLSNRRSTRSGHEDVVQKAPALTSSPNVLVGTGDGMDGH